MEYKKVNGKDITRLYDFAEMIYKLKKEMKNNNSNHLEYLYNCTLKSEKKEYEKLEINYIDYILYLKQLNIYNLNSNLYDEQQSLDIIFKQRISSLMYYISLKDLNFNNLFEKINEVICCANKKEEKNKFKYEQIEEYEVEEECADLEYKIISQINYVMFMEQKLDSTKMTNDIVKQIEPDLIKTYEYENELDQYDNEIMIILKKTEIGEEKTEIGEEKTEYKKILFKYYKLLISKYNVLIKFSDILEKILESLNLIVDKISDDKEEFEFYDDKEEFEYLYDIFIPLFKNNDFFANIHEQNKIIILNPIFNTEIGIINSYDRIMSLKLQINIVLNLLTLVNLKKLETNNYYKGSKIYETEKQKLSYIEPLVEDSMREIDFNKSILEILFELKNKIPGNNLELMKKNLNINCDYILYMCNVFEKTEDTYLNDPTQLNIIVNNIAMICANLFFLPSSEFDGLLELFKEKISINGSIKKVLKHVIMEELENRKKEDIINKKHQKIFQK